MVQVSNLKPALTVPFIYKPDNSKFSLLFRINIFILGMLAVAVGILALCGIPGISHLGIIGGSVFIGVGLLVILSTLSIKWKLKEHPDPDKHTKAAINDYLNDVS